MSKLLGTGWLTWPRKERINDRYGLVGLRIDDSDDFVTMAGLEGYGALYAVVLETRESGHIGDLFRGLLPSTPTVGEVVELGVGHLFIEVYDGVTYVGLRPKDGRKDDWLDPNKLYRVHDQTVELWFRPEDN